MKIIKPNNLAVLQRCYSNGEADLMALTGVILVPFGSRSAPLSEPALWRFMSEHLGKNAALDAGMPKTAGEFLVSGHCYAPDGAPVSSMVVHIAVGDREKSLSVTGDRHWTRTRDGWVASKPAPFISLELSYANAFGGAGFAHNPLGKGMPPQANDEPHPLPNILAPSSTAIRIDDRHEPVGFGPIDMTWPQRFGKVGTYDEHWRQTRFPGFAEDMDWSIFNTAPEDQWLREFLRGDESVRIDGMHPSEPRQRTELPGLAARCFITEQVDRNSAFREVPMHAETVWLFPNVSHMAIVFRGVTAIASDDASSVLHLVAGLEALDEFKQADHYQTVLAQRLDKRRGAVYSLDDAPLLPTSLKDALPLEALSKSSNIPIAQGFKDAFMRRKAEKELERAKQKLAAQREQILAVAREFGLPPPDFTVLDNAMATTLPAPTPTPRFDELPHLLDETERLATQAKADAIAKKEEAERTMRAVCAQNGLDYNGMTQGKAPQRFKASDILKKLKEAETEMKAFGMGNPLGAMSTSDPGLVQRLEQAEQAALAAYRRSAQYFPAATTAENTQNLRDQIVAGLAKGESFAGADLTGVDLSGLDLSRAEFSDALMESARLTNSKLRGACMRGTLLAHAVLDGADLDEADLTGANLGNASLIRVTARRANLSKVTLDMANLTKADLSDAQMADASLSSARLSGATLARVSASGLRFIDLFDVSPAHETQDTGTFEDLPGMDLRGIDLSGADLKDTLFFNARLDGAHLSGADLSKATMLGGSAERADFTSARLEGFRAVGGARLLSADFSGANLRRANLRETEMDRVNLSGACLEGADVSGASLRQAVLIDADAVGMRAVATDFSQARMKRIDLRNAVLQKARLDGADISDSNLYGADLLKVHHDPNTVLDGANLARTTLKANPS